MTIFGIDYSMTSPSICKCSGEFAFSECSFYYLTSKKKYEGTFDKMRGDPYPILADGTERFNFISDWAMKWVHEYKPSVVYIEDYAFGATGRVFHIAENTGLLKYKLWLAGVRYETVAPTSLKKYASGKGNAKKDGMEVAFYDQTTYNVKEVLGVPKTQWNPSSDIIDSYFLCKYGFNKENQEHEQK
jgi:Holliday junction resolvasome RuvABC endonuclease subunit